MGISVPPVHRPNGLVQFAAAILVDTDRVHPAEGHIVLRSSYLTELGDLGVTAPVQLAFFPILEDDIRPIVPDPRVRQNSVLCGSANHFLELCWCLEEIVGRCPNKHLAKDALENLISLKEHHLRSSFIEGKYADGHFVENNPASFF